MLSRVSLAARAAPLSAARPPLPFPSRSHGARCLLPSRQIHALCGSSKRLGPPFHPAKPQKRFNSNGSTSSHSSHNNEVPVGVVIGVGLLGIGIWLHLWSKQSITFPSVEGLTLRVRTVTTVAEHKVRELQTELYDVRSKLWDDIRNARSESASDVRSIRSELAKVDRKVHQHYLEFIPVQAKLRAVELRAIDPVADRSRVNAVLGDVRDELGAVRQSQAQTQAEVGAVRNQQAALEGMFDKLEKQKIERRRKKEEMANRRLV